MTVNETKTKEYVIISNQETLDEYCKSYFKKYPKRKKKPIDKPWHLSINKWFIMQRPQMNGVKQAWKDYTIWLVEKYGYTNLHIEKCQITYRFFMPTKRRADCDNYTPKFTNDGLTESGIIIDDDYSHCNPLIIQLGYDKDNPRMEIHIRETK